jgi:hypothetical protein
MQIVLPNSYKKSLTKCRGYLRIIFGHSYVGEFEAICKKALTHVSGAKGKLFDEKIQR